MDSTTVAELIESQEWINPVAETVSGGVATAYASAGAAGQKVHNFLNGTWQGHPLHPDLTDIPLGAWTVTAALDAAEIGGCETASAGADAALVIGLIGALGAAVTGFTDWHTIDDPRPKKIGAAHAILNVVATILYGTSLVLRLKKQRTLGQVLAGAGYALVGASAYLGGMLVFDQKIGVDHAPREGFPKNWTDVLEVADLAEGKPVCAKAGAIDIVVVKEGKTINALANVCSHLGGPLCEGDVRDGTIECPWHKSRFDLKTGAVVDGPATACQPVFETQVRSGKVQVRLVK